MLAGFKHSALALLVLVVLVATAAPAAAGKIEELRKAGTVGERFDGYVAIRAADPSDELKQAVDEINSRRKEIYAKRAAEESVSVEQVGRVYAKKIWDEAPEGTWFYTEDKEWVRK